MRHRTKHEAELRLSLGAARIAMREGKTPQEAVQAVTEHRVLMDALSHPQPPMDEDVVPLPKLSRAD